jgi:predicted esterase
MEIWRTALTESNSIDLELTAIQAPAPKGDGYAWWSMPDGVRSFTAERYDGFEESASAVLKAMQECDFDLVVGHSQGAILTTALLALNKIPRHPPRGYILNGVAWPNPYTKELESLQLQESVLMIVGATDEMNPPKQAMRVKSALQQAGCLVTVVNHSGGHSVPVDMNETLETILQWIVGKG